MFLIKTNGSVFEHTLVVEIGKIIKRTKYNNQRRGLYSPLQLAPQAPFRVHPRILFFRASPHELEPVLSEPSKNLFLFYTLQNYYFFLNQPNFFHKIQFSIDLRSWHTAIKHHLCSAFYQISSAVMNTFHWRNVLLSGFAYSQCTSWNNQQSLPKEC